METKNMFELWQLLNGHISILNNKKKGKNRLIFESLPHTELNLTREALWERGLKIVDELNYLSNNHPTPKGEERL